LCKSEKCNKKAKEPTLYCGKHAILAWKYDVEARGKKVCTNYTRACKEELDMSYPKQKCPRCLEKDRTEEQKRTAQKKESLPVINDQGNPLCPTCLKYHPVSDFMGAKGNVTKTCQACRDQNKKADANRDKEHRNALDRVAAQRPDRKATKQDWAKYNHIKVLTKDRKYKAKQMLQDPEAALEKGREQSAAFRAQNPEKIQEANQKRRHSPDAAYRVYKNSAAAKNLPFDCTQEWFLEMIRRPCHYCGGVDEERGFNGIDRMDCTQGYLMQNGVPCCHMCNLMKASLSEEVFLKRVEHMCAHSNLDPKVERRWPDIFLDQQGSLLSGVKTRANQLKVAFDLTAAFFEELHQSGCYLCGKVNTAVGDKVNTTGADVGKGEAPKKVHRNGTDRVDNRGGYTMDNVRPCCGQCNVMKKDFDLPHFQAKLLAICQYRQLPQKEWPPQTIPVGNTQAIRKHLKKRTPEEKAKAREDKKQARLAKLAEEWMDKIE